MFDQITSANDPIFYLHHSFIDLIWENWRLLRQPRDAREIVIAIQSYSQISGLGGPPKNFFVRFSIENRENIRRNQRKNVTICSTMGGAVFLYEYSYPFKWRGFGGEEESPNPLRLRGRVRIGSGYQNKFFYIPVFLGLSTRSTSMCKPLPF